MASSLRDIFGLTQERLAAWLGVNRGTVAMAESGGRNLPTNGWFLDVRLELAALGLALNPAGAPLPVPPLPVPPAQQPQTRRLLEVQSQLFRLQAELRQMQLRARQFEARLRAVPALRAYTGRIKNAEREAGWLALFEGEAVDGLRDECGAGPQALLVARLGGLAREAELLAERPLPE